MAVEDSATTIAHWDHGATINNAKTVIPKDTAEQVARIAHKMRPTQIVSTAAAVGSAVVWALRIAMATTASTTCANHALLTVPTSVKAHRMAVVDSATTIARRVFGATTNNAKTA